MSLGEINVELGAQKCKQKIDMMIIPPLTIIPPTTVYGLRARLFSTAAPQAG